MSHKTTETPLTERDLVDSEDQPVVQTNMQSVSNNGAFNEKLHAVLAASVGLPVALFVSGWLALPTAIEAVGKLSGADLSSYSQAVSSLSWAEGLTLSVMLTFACCLLWITGAMFGGR